METLRAVARAAEALVEVARPALIPCINLISHRPLEVGDIVSDIEGWDYLVYDCVQTGRASWSISARLMSTVGGVK